LHETGGNMKELSNVLSYQNERVVNKFMSYFRVSKEEALDIFQEMLKWLWLCSKAKIERKNGVHGVPKSLNVQSGMVVIDEYWHIFVLHTKDYADFCENYLGTFVHHFPSHLGFLAPTQAETENQLTYIYDNFDGEVTLKKWYITYAEKYSPDNLSLLRKPYIYGQPCQP
jgi:hypothetical protein